MELLVIGLVATLMPPVAMLTTGPLRIALGLAFVLFFPGYTLIAALFPRKDALDGVERLALSFGLSIAVVPLIGLGLNYTPWGIRLIPILVSLASFILAMAAIAYYRRQLLPPAERYDPQLRPKLAHYAASWREQGCLDRALTVALVLAVLGAAGTMAYVIATPKVGERFTEFYVLGPGGKAEGYPREIILGEQARVRLGVVNDEHEPATYRVVAAIDGESVSEIGPISLEHEQRWEEEVVLQPTKVGERQKVEFVLYKGHGDEPYRSLHLWMDVKRGP